MKLWLYIKIVLFVWWSFVKIWINCFWEVGLIFVKGLFNKRIFGFIVSRIVNVVFCFLLLDNVVNFCVNKVWVCISWSVVWIFWFIFLGGIFKFFKVKISFCFKVFIVNCWLGFWNSMLIFCVFLWVDNCWCFIFLIKIFFW